MLLHRLYDKIGLAFKGRAYCRLQTSEISKWEEIKMLKLPYKLVGGIMLISVMYRHLQGINKKPLIPQPPSKKTNFSHLLNV